MEGLKTYRHGKNPDEKMIHDKFVSLGRDQMSYILYGGFNGPKQHVTDHEAQVMITTVQWLCTPVGRDFMSSCGFELVDENMQVKKVGFFKRLINKIWK